MEKSNQFVKILPNIITTIRLVGAFVLIFLPTLSISFIIVYTLCGLTDAVDGFIARKYDAQSKVGAILDSVADLVFYGVMIAKIFSILLLTLPVWLWCVIWTIVALRVFCYAFVAIKFRKFASIHTILNKLSSVAMFFVPYSALWKFLYPYATAVAGITLLAVIEEIIIHATSSEYRPRKSLFIK